MIETNSIMYSIVLIVAVINIIALYLTQLNTERTTTRVYSNGEIDYTRNRKQKENMKKKRLGKDLKRAAGIIDVFIALSYIIGSIQ